MISFDSFYIVKMAGIDWDDPAFFWWVTLHPDFMQSYIEQRRALGRTDNF